MNQESKAIVETVQASDCKIVRTLPADADRVLLTPSTLGWITMVDWLVKSYQGVQRLKTGKKKKHKTIFQSS